LKGIVDLGLEVSVALPLLDLLLKQSISPFSTFSIIVLA